LRVWTKAGQWDINGTATFRTWLYRVVTNLAIDRTRKPRSLPLEAAGDPMDPSMDVEGDMERSEEAQAVRDALDQLPARQRAAVALCYFEGKTGNDAADILGMSVGAVESLLVRARRSLRSSLTELKDGRKEKSS